MKHEKESKTASKFKKAPSFRWKLCVEGRQTGPKS